MWIDCYSPLFIAGEQLDLNTCAGEDYIIFIFFTSDKNVQYYINKCDIFDRTRSTIGHVVLDRNGDGLLCDLPGEGGGLCPFFTVELI